MSWQNINIKDIPSELQLVPEKTFTFEILPGAKYDNYNAASTRVAIVNDGEFTNRQLFLSYPDPESTSPKSGKVNDWSGVAFKRLTQALGVDIEEHEDPVAYLTRVAGNRFQTNITHYQADENSVKRASLALFNVKPSA